MVSVAVLASIRFIFRAALLHLDDRIDITVDRSIVKKKLRPDPMEPGLSSSYLAWRRD
jgi:hypothetical protein